ncbi:MAG: hypothetical protein QM611_03355 [Microbacterium sp.]|uniref:hypothetical protein n=1 Tax=Microbacterium sp. TaxID=51671 RepID=UPI0039E3C47B
MSSMTAADSLDFTDAVRGEFRVGEYLAPLQLVGVSQLNDILTICFDADDLRPGRYGT